MARSTADAERGSVGGNDTERANSQLTPPLLGCAVQIPCSRGEPSEREMQTPHTPTAGGAAATTPQPPPTPTVTRVRIPTRVQPHSRIAPEAGAQTATTATAAASSPVSAVSIVATSSSAPSSRSASSATPTPLPTAPRALACEVSVQSAASATAVVLTPTHTPAAAAEEFPPPPADAPARYVAATLPEEATTAAAAPPTPSGHAAAPFDAAAASSPAGPAEHPAPVAPPESTASSASNPASISIGVSSDDDEMGDVDDDEAMSTAASGAVAAVASDSLDRCFCSDPQGLHTDLVCSRYDDRPWLQAGVKCYTTHARCVRTADGLPFCSYVMGISAFLCRACITRPGFTPPDPSVARQTYASDAGQFYDLISDPPAAEPQTKAEWGRMETENHDDAAAAAAMPSTPPRAPSSVARSSGGKSSVAPRAPASAARASATASKFDSSALIDLSGDADAINDLTALASKPARFKRPSVPAAAGSSGLFAPVTAPFVLRRLVLRLDGAPVPWPRRLDADHTEDDATVSVRVCPYKLPGPRSSRIRSRTERAIVVQAQRELDESMRADTESDAEDQPHGGPATSKQHTSAVGKKSNAPVAPKAKPRVSSSSTAAAAASVAPAAPPFPAIQHSLSASGRSIFWCRCDCAQRCVHLHPEHTSTDDLASKDRSFESILQPLFERDSTAASAASSSDATSVTELSALGSTLLPGLISLFESTGVSAEELLRMPPVLLHKCLCQVAHAHSTATYRSGGRVFA